MGIGNDTGTKYSMINQNENVRTSKTGYMTRFSKISNFKITDVKEKILQEIQEQNKLNPEVSFSHICNKIQIEERLNYQKNMMPTYFITLLHLANEKNLKIQNKSFKDINIFF